MSLKQCCKFICSRGFMKHLCPKIHSTIFFNRITAGSIPHIIQFFCSQIDFESTSTSLTLFVVKSTVTSGGVRRSNGGTQLMLFSSRERTNILTVKVFPVELTMKPNCRPVDDNFGPNSTHSPFAYITCLKYHNEYEEFCKRTII